jgi:hypothetical protein
MDNVYASGGVSTGNGGNAGGLIGLSDGCHTNVTYAYWNSDARQTVNGVERAVNDKLGVGTANYGINGEVTAKTAEDMKACDFALLLNSKLNETYGKLDTNWGEELPAGFTLTPWSFVTVENGGYPVLKNDTAVPAVSGMEIKAEDSVTELYFITILFTRHRRHRRTRRRS